jgi:hypothetical protein
MPPSPTSGRKRAASDAADDDDGGSKKRPSSSSSSSKSKSNKRSSRSSSSKNTNKNSRKKDAPPSTSRSLSSLGFSSEKKAKFQKGMKILLDDSIYDRASDIPEAAKGKYFVYELTKLDDATYCTIEYKDQLIEEGGDRFQVFKEGEETQVCVCSCFVVCFLFFFFTNNTLLSSFRVHAIQTGRLEGRP